MAVTVQTLSAAARLSDVLGAMCREMTSLGRLASDLQADLSPVERSVHGGMDQIETLQSLDLITQRLQGVAAFLAALGPTVPAVWTCDAVAASRAVCLADLARRLANPAHEGGQTDATELGTVELFEA